MLDDAMNVKRFSVSVMQGFETFLIAWRPLQTLAFLTPQVSHARSARCRSNGQPRQKPCRLTARALAVLKVRTEVDY